MTAWCNPILEISNISLVSYLKIKNKGAKTGQKQKQQLQFNTFTLMHVADTQGGLSGWAIKPQAATRWAAALPTMLHQLLHKEPLNGSIKGP